MLYVWPILNPLEKDCTRRLRVFWKIMLGTCTREFWSLRSKCL